MNKMKWWIGHLAIFVAAQVILLIAGQSWPAAFLASEVPESLTFAAAPAMWISRLWCVVFAIDTVWFWGKLALARRETADQQ